MHRDRETIRRRYVDQTGAGAIDTASRSSEVRLAEWSEFDFDDKVWEIPAERMKMNRSHRVPLSPRAVSILTDARVLADGSGLVFPSTIKGRPLSDMTLSKLVKELGFDADVHGFRTSFRTWVQERTTFPREVHGSDRPFHRGNELFSRQSPSPSSSPSLGCDDARYSALALNTASLGHNFEGYGAAWEPERVIDACASRGFG
ncbi:tyrosine-type recombinase/integrase [Shinella sp. BYT-45]|uniref:tyrosine-type recombinase/integrase n=1 Tax=Shinella sp. BYT-45 TaxID=3377377 RepID=UPI00397F89DC